MNNPEKYPKLGYYRMPLSEACDELAWFILNQPSRLDEINRLAYLISQREGDWILIGKSNPKRINHQAPRVKSKNPIKKFPLLGLGLIAGIGYLIWRASKQA